MIIFIKYLLTMCLFLKRRGPRRAFVDCYRCYNDEKRPWRKERLDPKNIIRITARKQKLREHYFRIWPENEALVMDDEQLLDMIAFEESIINYKRTFRIITNYMKKCLKTSK